MDKERHLLPITHPKKNTNKHKNKTPLMVQVQYANIAKQNKKTKNKMMKKEFD